MLAFRLFGIRVLSRVVLIGLLTTLPGMLAAEPGRLAVEGVGRESGLPLPRFVSLAANVANLRLGPRTSDEVIAVYRRPGLPLRVVDEHDNWRRVEDFEGDRGWMHASLLSGRRTVLVVEAARVLRRAPSTSAPAIARVEATVVGDLLSCNDAWCFVEVGGRRGWLPRSGIWGIDP